MTFVLTGLDIEAKAELVERTFWAAFPGGVGAFDFVDATLVRSDQPDPATNEDAVAELVAHGDGRRCPQGRTGLLERRHRDGAGQLPGPVRARGPG